MNQQERQRLHDVALVEHIARDIVRQIADEGPPAERLRLDLDVWEWTLITIALRDNPTQGCHDLADLIETRLRHPSARLPNDDCSPFGMERPVQS